MRCYNETISTMEHQDNWNYGIILIKKHLLNARNLLPIWDKVNWNLGWKNFAYVRTNDVSEKLTVSMIINLARTHTLSLILSLTLIFDPTSDLE